MTLFNKIKWILGVVLVFLLVLTTNLVDRHHFSAMADTVETIYADRLVAHSIIYDLSEQLWQLETAYATREGDRLSRATAATHEEIEEAVDRFAATKLTERESLVFDRLRRGLGDLQEREEALVNGEVGSEVLQAEAAAVRTILRELSDIQLTEGERQLTLGRKALGLVHFFTQVEIVGLVVLAIIVQFIILYPTGEQRDTDTYR
ncbi:hypothetical protein GGR26_001169 [Lewinella marina]|uniref:Chemotaxis methyl-accepting receptor HlyB-like 4HB MCP domain-containing protein n=1 Tax=Neolewinella marina TaxID=438751 RepID=A0A2G0CFX1_9BACT|nr:MCP four helix bundle domain-containing protein [Neolewinella marina]NJB85424.1 hypothetical protein [Neolewinella marina]PHK98884.1 hypothetical protein CGL56_10510 [Neolewinella marina]